jgi:hypothetical protein
MKQIILILIIIFCYIKVDSQSIEKDMSYLNCDSTYNLNDTTVAILNGKFDKEAEFPGGIKELTKYLMTDFNLPKGVQNWHGRYYVHFIIDTNGYAIDACILRPINPYPYGDLIMEKIKNMPRWEPAVKNNKKVPSRYFTPFSFCIAYNKKEKD